MDTTLKQRILGILILLFLLGFCLVVLLRNTKSPEPNIPKISTHPFAQTSEAVSPPAPALKSALSPSFPTPSAPSAKATITLPPATSTVLSAAPKLDAPGTPAPTPAPANTANQNKNIAAAPLASNQPQPVQTVPNINTTTVPAQKIPNTPQQPAALSNVSSTLPAAPLPVAVASHRNKHISHHPASHHPVIKTAKGTSQKNLVIQVGTFSAPANAYALVDKLRAKGFTATAQKMNTSKGPMTRVIVGQKGLNQIQAEALRHKLSDSLHLEGFIVSHSKD